jgi:prophage regulatory protein
MNPAQQPEPILVSVNNAAAMLGISRQTIYKLLNAGALRAVKGGGRTLIPTQALREYAESLAVYVPAAQSGVEPKPALSVEAAPPGKRMLRFKAVLARTGLSRQQLFVRRTAGTFPPGVTLSKGVLGWDQADVDDWLVDPANYRAKP